MPERSETAAPNFNLFSNICASAVQCDRCFKTGYVQRPFIDIAQPRYVGARYWTRHKRLLFVLINPGAGRGSISDQEMRRDLYDYRTGVLELPTLLARQKKYIPEWSKGRFISYFNALGCDLDDIGLLNIAWCATEGDYYPDGMLTECFGAYTQAAIQALQPTHVVACGGKAQAYLSKIEIDFIPARHPAARLTIDFTLMRRLLGHPVLVEPENADRMASSKSPGSRASDNGTAVIRLLAPRNPKSGKSFVRFQCYRDGMTIAEYEEGVRANCGAVEAKKCRADLKWDSERRFIRIEKQN